MPQSLPAATAIGRFDGQRRLQVYWLAARKAGQPLENPRQVNTWRYPRQYGPQPPSFARAMLPAWWPATPNVAARAPLPLLISGTASIIGHSTMHRESTVQQLAEVFNNLNALLRRAHELRPSLSPHFGAGSRLKVYVRDATDMAAVRVALRQHLPSEAPYLLLHGCICRSDLRVEIEAIHAPFKCQQERAGSFAT